MSDKVDVVVEIIEDDPRKNAICVADGSMTVLQDGRQALKHYWLPRSQITINDNGTVSVAEWLAMKEGLI